MRLDYSGGSDLKAGGRRPREGPPATATAAYTVPGKALGKNPTVQGLYFP